jgi:phosphodiesterase/alkaline phosphatase D-like protein
MLWARAWGFVMLLCRVVSPRARSVGQRSAFVACLNFVLFLAMGCAWQAAPAALRFVPASHPPDRSVDVINGPAADKIDMTSAVIWWNTDVKSTSVVHYGTSPTDLSEQAANAGRSTKHEIRLEHLRPSTTYYFQVESARQDRSTAKSKVGVFKTMH